MTSLSHKFWHLVRKIKDDDIMPWSSMLTIYLLLSIFPLIIIMTDLFARFSLNNPELLIYMTGLFPAAIYDTLADISSELASQQDSTVIPIAALITLWSASRGILAIIKALNKAYGIHESRGYVRLRLIAFSYTLGFVFLIVLALVLLVFGNNILSIIRNWVVIPAFLGPIISYLRYGVTLLVSLFFFVSLYNICPSEQSGFRKVLPGAVFATIGLIATSAAFSLYVNQISNLSYLYGSLTGFIIVIVWLFIVSVVIMVGGEINAVFFEEAQKPQK